MSMRRAWLRHGLGIGLLGLAALPATAQDLLTVWRAAEQHDRTLAVARAEHAAAQTKREQAETLWRPNVMLGLGAGLGASDTRMKGAQFSAPGFGTSEGVDFATSVHAGVTTRAALTAQQPLVNRGRDAARAQLELGAEMGSMAWRAGRDVILIGHAGHPEVEGTMGQWLRENGGGSIHLVEDIDGVATLQVGQPQNLAYTTQTTLSVDDTRGIIEALQQRYPAIQGPRHDDICYATQNRQDAVRELAARCDLVLVVGSPNSSNSNRLAELARREGVQSYLIDGAHEIDPAWVMGKRRIGLTAGASAPQVLVDGAIERLRELGAGEVAELDGEPEDMVFALPKELRLRLVD